MRRADPLTVTGERMWRSFLVGLSTNNYLEEEPVSGEALGLNSFVTEKEQHFQVEDRI